MIDLFVKILRGAVFHFGDNPEKKLIKFDDHTYIAPVGRRHIHPHVAVVPDVSKSKDNPEPGSYNSTEQGVSGYERYDGS